jgi:hypothetical protein
MLDAADTYREAVDGDLIVDGDSVWGFLVFRTLSGRSGGPISVLTDFGAVFPGEGRANDGLPIDLWLSVSCDAFLRGVLGSVVPLPSAMLCLADGIFILEGLSAASETLFGDRGVGDATDRRFRDGKRSLDTGWDRNSFPSVWPEDDRDGDRE